MIKGASDLRMEAPADHDVELSVVVVTWNCRDLALRCLRTIVPAVARISHEILVIDNASSDGTLDAVAASFPMVQTILSPSNVGFAAANNVALAQARGRYWLLLNPDAFPAGADMVADLLGFMVANPDVGAAAPRLRYADGRHQVGDAGFAPTLGTVAVHALSLMRLSTRLRGVFLTGTRLKQPLDVDWLCGACLMVRADAVRQVGPLDESFFMYGEDIEWGCRMRDHGWRVVYLPSLEATHLVGGTQNTGEASMSTRWLDGLSEVYRRRNGSGGMVAFCITLAIGYGCRALLYWAISLMPGGRPRVTRARSMVVYALYGLYLRPRAIWRVG